MGMSRSLSQPFLLHQSLSQPDPSQLVPSVSSTYASVFHHPSHSAAVASHHSPPLTQYTTVNTAHDRVLNDSNNSVDTTTTTANHITDIRTISGSFLLPPTAHRTTTNSSSLLLNHHVQQQSYLLPPPSRMERAMDHVDDIDMDANDDDDDDGIGEAFDLDME